MGCFKIRLAGQTITIHPIYNYAEEFCKEYLVDDDSAEPCAEIFMTQDEIEEEKTAMNAHRAETGLPGANYSDRYAEIFAIHRKVSRALLDSDVLLMHGSAVAAEGKGIIFAAPSGTGKSTHTALWKKAYGDKVTVINDDKPLIRVEEACKVCGSPWSGRYRLNTNTEAPLTAVCFLHRGKENLIQTADSSAVFSKLLQFSYRTDFEGDMQKLLILVKNLSQRASFFDVWCNTEDNAAVFIHDMLMDKLK